MEQTEYLRDYEKRLQDELLKLCTNYKLLDGQLVDTFYEI